MSYQAITDIIVNPQIQDLQLSNTVKDSPEKPSVSFADILASFNNAENPKTDSKPVQTEEKVSGNAETEKSENAESLDKTENAEKTTENQVKNENDSEKSSDKTVEKAESANDTDKKISEIDGKNDRNLKNLKKDNLPEEVNESDGKKISKTEGKEKNKKLSDKDFSRMEELTDNFDSEIDSAKLAANAQSNVKTVKSETDAEIKSENNENDSLELNLTTDLNTETAMNKVQSQDNKSSDFDFSGKGEKSKKQFALDKDGKIIVEDERTKAVSDTENKKPAIKTSEIKLSNENTAVMSVELNPNAEADVLSLNTQTAAANGSNFQAMLSNQLHNVAPEFVKAGNLILKDNNQGTINLILHPDDIGNVKIHLSLDGKTLNGHITVATKEALQVFKDNAETLREAFIKNGFDAANFDVAMNNGGSFNQNMGFGNQNEDRSLFAKRMYGDSAEGLSAELDDILENAEDISNYSVNIVA